MGQWDRFLQPYKQAVDELKIKLKGIRTEFQKTNQTSPIEFVTGRVKPLASIYDKTMEKGLIFEPSTKLAHELQDIAGVRIMCQFVDDIHTVIDLLRQRNDLNIVEEKDYITNSKASGYRSYHVIVEYPVATIKGEVLILAEIQIRTLAMNFWASIEHSLNYKYKGEFPDEIMTRLQSAAEAAFRLDEEMSLIRSEIHEAQKYFTENKELPKPLVHSKREKGEQSNV
ncbi:GTP pyrophosphokinase [Kurthia sibirica]|uniref:GTP diphosphokinase n=1 Tax=Kurthia sibirica TaxID=202750 RepID=A0A2U3AMU5_9BACL|nr:GTP pyrophosphokinase family protein [Kurthia sibirica]PWI25858.1 GTP pyrophosphokinase [Kurthia sibirica]GEK34294.1 GTP pyrophosphokinase [Kurthia sibirica]